MKYLKLIPKGWNEVKVKDYLRLIQLIDGETDTDEIFAASFFVFTGVSLIDSNIKFEEINAIGHRLLFIGDLPKEGATKIKLKKIKDLTYHEYINFQGLTHSPINNLIPIIKTFAKETIDEDKLTMSEAIGCFFLLHRVIKKRLILLAFFTMFNLMKWKMKTLFKKMLGLKMQNTTGI